MQTDVKTEKSENFAVKIVSLYKFLTFERHESVISKQLLRSGTSIGANIAEANFAESKGDFIHKLSISRKECAETAYWLKLLFRSGYMDKPMYDSFNTEAYELLRILTAIITQLKKS